MPYIYFDKKTKKIKGNSGIPSLNSPEEYIQLDVIQNFGGTINDYGYFEVTENELKEIYNSHSYELIFDDKGNPTGYKTYKKIQVNCPKTTQVGKTENITISAEKGEGAEIVLYVDDVEQVREFLPCSIPIQFEVASTYLIKIDAGKHGVVEKEVVVK